MAKPSKKPRRLAPWLAALAVVVLAAALAPWSVRAYWSYRSSNPVRRGVANARELGCFSCHGDLGKSGIPAPGLGHEAVPAWHADDWRRYVRNDDDVRSYILEGAGDEPPALGMPAYAGWITDSELDDLVAAFKVLAGMTLPPAGSPARNGYRVAGRWACFSCHGPGGSGGLPNPGSWAGFVPGWYGPDFADLVRDRGEFEAWILEGMSPRMRASRIGSYFSGRQRLKMPAYRGLPPNELDDLWAYVQWLSRSDGGHLESE